MFVCVIHAPTHRHTAQQPEGLGGTTLVGADVLSYGCSRFAGSVAVVIFSFVLAHFVTGLFKADREVIVPFPVLETRWEYLHTGRGVASSGLGLDTLF